MIQINNLSKVYHQGSEDIVALDNASLVVKPGESVSIVGPSGSGKTTLLSLMAGLERATRGSIKINNVDLTLLNEKQLSQFRANHMAIVFQRFHLMEQLTALENVRLAADILGHKHAAQKAQEALSEVGLEDRHNHMMGQLSGGERQRVAIARAFVVSPKILLADEPSGNLDTETGKKVMNIIFRLIEKRQMTLILVTHDWELAKKCKQQVSIKGGKIQI